MQTLACCWEALCNRFALLFNSLQTVQSPIAWGAPQPTWATALFAFDWGLHKKRTQSPSAGGG